jgi:hypothetical protein
MAALCDAPLTAVSIAALIGPVAAPHGPGGPVVLVGVVEVVGATVVAAGAVVVVGDVVVVAPIVVVARVAVSVVSSRIA